MLVFLRGHGLLSLSLACKKGKVLYSPGSLPAHLCNGDERFGLRQYCPGGGFSILCSCWFKKLLLCVDIVEYGFFVQQYDFLIFFVLITELEDTFPPPPVKMVEVH